TNIYSLSLHDALPIYPSIDVDQNEDEPKQTSEEKVAAVFDAFSRFGTGAQSGHELAEAITAAGRASGDADMLDFTVQDVEIRNRSEEHTSELQSRSDL